MSKRDVFTRFFLDNSWVVEFPTRAGVLRLLPGKVAVEAAFAEEKEGEGYDNRLRCVLRVADADGRVWEATSRFLTGGLFWGIVDLSRPEPARWVRNAPEAWREALSDRPLLTGATAAWDDRAHRHAWVDNTSFWWSFKYFAADFGLAALDGTRILVSVGNMFCSWAPLSAVDAAGVPLPKPTGLTSIDEDELERLEEAGEFGDYEHMHPLAYSIDAGHLLFRNTAAKDDEGYWRGLPLSRPLVFRPTRRKGEPQRCVAFHKGQSLSAQPSPGGEDGFVTMGEEYGETVEFATNEGGRLVVDGGFGRYRVKAEKHPDGVREPFDVLRFRVRVADDAGTLWECVTHCTPEVLFERMVDLENAEEPTISDAHHAPVDHGLTGIRALLEGGWRCAFMGGRLVAFQGRGQRPTVDISPHAGGFGVRVSGLVGRQLAVKCDGELIELDPGDGAVKRTAWKKDGPLPAISFTIPVAALVFRNTTFAVDDGFWHRNAIPIPVVFTRVGTAAPDPKVGFVAGFADTDD